MIYFGLGVYVGLAIGIYIYFEAEYNREGNIRTTFQNIVSAFLWLPIRLYAAYKKRIRR